MAAATGAAAARRGTPNSRASGVWNSSSSSCLLRLSSACSNAAKGAPFRGHLLQQQLLLLLLQGCSRSFTWRPREAKGRGGPPNRKERDCKRIVSWALMRLLRCLQETPPSRNNHREDEQRRCCSNNSCCCSCCLRNMGFFRDASVCCCCCCCCCCCMRSCAAAICMASCL